MKTHSEQFSPQFCFLQFETQGIWKGLGVAIKKLKISTMSDSDADSFREEANLMFRFR